MNDMIDYLNYYRDFLEKHHSADVEIFLVNNNYYNIEYIDNFAEYRHEEQKGIGVRIFYDTYTEFRCCDGWSIETFNQMMKAKSFCSKVPTCSKMDIKKKCISLAGEQLDFNSFLSTSKEMLNMFKKNFINIPHSIIRDIYKNKEVIKFGVEYKQEEYIILSNVARNGYSIRNVFQPSLMSTAGECIEYISPNILPFDCYNSLLQKTCESSRLPIRSFGYKSRYFLFSGNAVAIIIYCLSLLLSKNMIVTGNSFFCLKDIGKKILDDRINLEENSSGNKVIIGSVDGEGIPRRICSIIENGYLKTMFSDYAPEYGLISSGSAYRFLHTELPYIKPSKVFLKGDKDIKSIETEYNTFFKIEDLNGFVESFDPKTSEFSAQTIAVLYKNGLPVIKCKLNLSGKIVELLKEVVETYNDYHYGIDGSIYTGSILINYNDFRII